MVDVLIIGGGPAGLSAAITCVENGLSVRIIDEFVKPGGRLLGQLHQEPSGDWWNGIEEANKLNQQLTFFKISVECGKSVYNIEKEDDKWLIYVNNEIIEAQMLLLATGAAEVSIPVPGWTLPGVMSIGAAQVMSNVHRIRPGRKGIVIGLNVLSFAITRELQLAGVDISAMVLPPKHLLTQKDSNPKIVMERLLKLSHLAPSKFIQTGGKLVKTDWMKGMVTKFYPQKGVNMWGIPIHVRKSAVEILGNTQVEAVRINDIDTLGNPINGTEKEIEVDFVCISGGLYPLAELAGIIGCPFHFIESLGGHVPIHNNKMETPVNQLYVAGNITGIESAKVAMAQGKIAGLSIIKSIKGDSIVDRMLEDALEETESIRRNSSIQFHEGITEGRQLVHSLYETHTMQSV